MATRPVSPAALGGFDHAGNLTATPGSRDWAIAVRLELQGTLHDMKADASHLDAMYRLMLTHKGYEQLTDEQGRPFADFTAFCLARLPYGLGMPPAMIDRLIEDRKTAQASAYGATPQLTLEQAMRGNKNAVKDKEVPGATPPPPTIGDILDGRNSGVNHTTVSERGSGNAKYGTARIARDHPAILERMQAGEFPSVHAAAKEAGIAKRRVSVPCDPIGAARILSRHFDRDQIRALIEALIDADHT